MDGIIVQAKHIVHNFFTEEILCILLHRRLAWGSTPICCSTLVIPGLDTLHHSIRSESFSFLTCTTSCRMFQHL